MESEYNKDNNIEAFIAIAEVTRNYSNCALQELKGLEKFCGITRSVVHDPCFNNAYQIGFSEGRNFAYNTIYNLLLEQTKMTDEEMRLKIAEKRLSLHKTKKED